jgi:hypothetical protein
MDGHDAERALSRALKARTAARRPPDPPEALRVIARGEHSAGARSGQRGGARESSRASAADLGWAALLAACLACALIIGRGEGELARALDEPSFSRALQGAISSSNIRALELRLGAEPERERGRK